jgi:hypothetical protein
MALQREYKGSDAPILRFQSGANQLVVRASSSA